MTVLCGEYCANLPLLEVGPLVHSKYLTTAGRISNLYVVKENLSELYHSYIIYYVDADVWFHITIKLSLIERGRYIFKLMTGFTYLEPNL